jgi:predicted MPP superfamily phosphohydrolase
MGTTKAAVIGATAVGLSAASWAILVEPGRIAMRAVTLTPPGWPPALSGLRVAVLSDVHTGSPHVSRTRLRTIVERVNAESPDVVLLLGDYVIHGVVGGSFVAAEETADDLAALRAPGGVVSVLGNHDWWYDGERVRRALLSRGIVVLENEVHAMRRSGMTVWLAGLADLWTRQPDIEGTLGKVPEGAPVLLLTHSPDVFPQVPPRVALTLAGHTHGGQVRLPPLPPPVVPSRFGARYAAGHIVEDGRHLFVTTGIGTSIIPVRFAVPPEFVVVTLR